MTRPGTLRIAFWVTLAVQFWALYVPRAPGVQTGLPLDKVVHIALFAVVTWVGLRASLPPRVLIPGMILQAGASELVQHLFLARRGGDWWDFAADLVGIGLGVVLASRVKPAVRPRG